MIPRHRPPFGTVGLLQAGIRSCFRSGSVEDLERQYRQQADVRHAVWIPSARYGITRTIQHVLPTHGEVVCPVFNCGAVHHAARETGRPIRFTDNAPTSFLMDCRGQAGDDNAVILSEMFGHRFSDSDLHQPLVKKAAVRVFDMAMAIPTTVDMTRMQDDDVTVLSFGLGKIRYAGWGGMALTQSDQIADMLRRNLALDADQARLRNRLRWNLSMLLRTLAHEPAIYGPLRHRQMRRQRHASDQATSFHTNSHEWHRSTTALHVNICLRNLKTSPSCEATRCRLSDEYRRQLRAFSEFMILPPNESQPLSHFSIRVPGPARDKLKDGLWRQGIDAGTLFPFPHHECAARRFPDAARAAGEVLNLPLSNQLNRRTVIHICDVLKSAADRILHNAAPRHHHAA
ncbi:MAG: DegT/DnrJ/EryC1/StrS family aminotransferase [Fuerstiella sp.]